MNDIDDITLFLGMLFALLLAVLLFFGLYVIIDIISSLTIGR